MELIKATTVSLTDKGAGYILTPRRVQHVHLVFGEQLQLQLQLHLYRNFIFQRHSYRSLLFQLNNRRPRRWRHG